MKSLVLIAGTVGSLIVLSANAETAENVVKIPLKDIWAMGMPGTRNVRDLEKGTGQLPQNAPLSDAIGDALPLLPDGKSPSKGFAVLGTEKEALQNAADVLTKKQQLKCCKPKLGSVSSLRSESRWSLCDSQKGAEAKQQRAVLGERTLTAAAQSQQSRER